MAHLFWGTWPIPPAVGDISVPWTHMYRCWEMRGLLQEVQNTVGACVFGRLKARLSCLEKALESDAATILIWSWPVIPCTGGKDFCEPWTQDSDGFAEFGSCSQKAYHQHWCRFQGDKHIKHDAVYAHILDMLLVFMSNWLGMHVLPSWLHLIGRLAGLIFFFIYFVCCLIFKLSRRPVKMGLL